MSQPGQVLQAGTPALILGEGDDGFVFRAPVIDRNASKLRVGMVAEISLPALAICPHHRDDQRN
jgi:hypothetical protein